MNRINSWGEIAGEYVEWFKKWDKVIDYNFDVKRPTFTSSFLKAASSTFHNCLDKNLKTRANKVAIQWKATNRANRGLSPINSFTRKSANSPTSSKPTALKRATGFACICPWFRNSPSRSLACTRIGAIHTIVFGGFSSDALRDRIQDSQAKLLAVCDGTFRGAKAVPQKASADEAPKDCPSVKTVIVVNRVGDKIKCAWTEGRDKMVA